MYEMLLIDNLTKKMNTRWIMYHGQYIIIIIIIIVFL